MPILTFFGDTAFLVHNIADIYFKLEVRVKMIDCLDLIPLMLVLLLFLQHSGKSLVSLSLSVDIPLLSTFNRTWKQRFDDEEQGGKKRRKNRLIQPIEKIGHMQDTRDIGRQRCKVNMEVKK